MSKNIILILMFLMSILKLQAQCPNDNIFWDDFTPAAPGSSYTDCLFGGEYATVNVVLGDTYTFSLCSNTFDDTEITLLNNIGGAFLAYDDDGCGSFGGPSTITWVATFTGTVRVLVDDFPCSSGATCYDMVVTWTSSTPPPPPAGNTSCDSMAPICTNVGLSFTAQAVGSSASILDPGNNYGCLTTQPDPTWYYLEIATSGVLNMNLTATADIDYIIYGPFANLTAAQAACGTMGNGGVGGSIIDCSYDPTNNEFPVISTAVAGQVYVMLITNFAGIVQNISLTSLASSTATTDCSIVTTCAAEAGTQTITIDGVPASGILELCQGDCLDIETDSNFVLPTPVAGEAAELMYAIYDGLPNTSIEPDLDPNFTGLFWTGGDFGDCNDATSILLGAGLASHLWLVPITMDDGDNNGNPNAAINYDNDGDGCYDLGTPIEVVYLAPITRTITETCTQVTITLAGGYPAFNPAATYTVTNTGAGSMTQSGAQGQTITITGFTPGQTVSINVTNDGNGCTASFNYVTTPRPTVTLNSITNVLCNGGNNGAVNVSLSGGATAPCTYTLNMFDSFGDGWNGGFLTVIVNGVPVGTYAATGTGSTATIVVPNGQSLQLNYTAGSWEAENTYNLVLGGSTIFSNGPTPTTGNVFSTTCAGLPVAYTYSWSNGRTTEDITGLTAGSYTLTVVDPILGCNVVAGPYTVTQPSAVTASIASSTNVACNGGATGSATVAGAGGTGAYSFTWSNGRTTAANTGLTAGTYCVTVSDANACTASVCVTITQPSAVTASIASSTNALCNGGSTGSATAAGSGGTGAYSFVWSNGRTTAANTGLAAGTYCVTVSDANACTASVCVTITQPSAVTASIASSTNVLCNGGSTGSATAAGAGGTGAYSFVWSNGRTTAANTGLAAGTYCVTVSDANACTASVCVTITQPSAVTASIASSTNATCGATNGSATAAGAGGTGAYSFTWSNGRTTAANTGLAAGIYTVTVSDANACTATTSVTITQPSAVTASIASSTNVLCNGGATGSATAAGAGGSGGYTFSWSNGRTTAANTGLAAGTYTVTVSDASSCTATASVTITQPSAVTASIASSTNALCNGGATGSATAAGAGGTGAYSFVWSNGRTTAANTGLAAGTYCVTVSDANACTASVCVTITQPSAVTASIASSTNVLCNGGATGSATAAGAGGTGAYSFVWSNGRTTAANTGLAAGTYCVTVSDANACTASVCVTITQPSAVTASIASSTNVLCNGASTGLATAAGAGGTGAYTFTWSNGRTTAANTGLAAGTYTVTVRDANNCTATASVTITQPSATTITISNVTNTACSGTSGAIDITVAGGTGAYTYNWSNGGTTQDITGLAAGTYTVTVTDANGCTSTNFANVSNTAAGTISFTVTNPLCNGGTGCITPTITGGTGRYGYLWSNGSTLSSLCGLPAGNYTLTVTDTISSGTGGGQVNLYQQAFDGAHGWTLNVLTGANGAQPNVWEVNDTEGGVNPPGCGVGGNGNQTLHITCTSLFCGSLITGAVYNATQTSNRRAESPAFSTVGFTGLTLKFNFIANGNGLLDNASLLYNDGVGGWQVLNPSLKSTICGSGQGRWTQFAVALPASCNNNPNVRIGFNWTNNNDNVGTDPSIAVDSVVVFSNASGSGAQICTIINSTTITQPSAVTATIASSTNIACNGGSTGSATAAGSGGTGAHTFLWSNGRTTAANTGLAAGTYTVTVSDANACTATTSVTITQPSAVTATIASSTNVLCNGGSTGSATAAGAGGTGAYSFIWSNGRTTAANTGLAVGTYCVTVTDANACTASVCVTITQPSAVTASIASSTNVLCNGGSTGSATAAGSGGTGAYSFIWSNGSTTSTNTGLAAGTYCVTVSDANACTASVCVTITQPSAVTASIASSTNANCGTADGSATAAGAGGTGAYSFIWSNGRTTALNTGLAAGTYIVTVSDANACTATTSVTITQPGSVTASIASSTSVTCNGLANGSATASAVGGSGTYTYSWSNGRTTAANTGLAAGVYTVSVNDGGACIVTAVVTITQPTAVTASIASFNNVLCNGGATGAATAAGAGGTGTYSFVWSNGRTTAANTGLVVGTYTVTVTDANGCTATTTRTITQPNVLAASVDTIGPVVCTGSSNGFINIAVSGGTGVMTYNWSNGATTQNISGLVEATYYFTVTDANGCITNDSAMVITIGQIAILLDTIINNNCNGDSLGAIYISKDTTSAISCFSNQVALNEIMYRPIAANGVNPNTGEYLELIGPPGANIGCYVLTDGDWTITIPPGTVIPPDGIFTIGNNIVWGAGTFDLDAENCGCFTDGAGGSGLLILTDGGEYIALFNGAGTFVQGVIFGAPTAGNSPSGNVISTIGTGGCPTFVTIPMPAVFELAPGSFANGTSIIRNPDGSGSWGPQIGGSLNNCNISGTAGIDTSITYIWSNGATTQDNTGLTAGSYTVTATNSYGCTTTATFTVTEPALLTTTINSITNVECAGNATGNIDINVAGGTSPYNYAWSNGATTEDVTGLVAGNYCVTITDALGCMTSICDSITEPYFSIPNDTFYICIGDSVQISVNTNATVISWTPSATLSNDTIFNPYASPTTTTTYVVSAAVSTSATCAMIDSVIVIVGSVDISLAGTNVSCFGDSTGSITTTSAGTYNYLWNTGATTANLNNLPAGVYSVTATNSGSCFDTASITITEPTQLVLTINSVTNIECMGNATGAINIDVVGGTNPYTYAWSNGTILEDATGLTPGNYCVTVTDSLGCMTTICDSITEPFFSIPTDTFFICPGDAVQIFVNTNASVINWTPSGSLDNSTIFNPTASPGVSTTYVVTAAVSGSASCVMTDSVVVLVGALDVTLASSTNVGCFGDSTGSITTSIVGSNFSYLWNTGATTANLNNLGVGTYSLTVSNSGSCQDTLTVTITGPVSPLAVNPVSSTDVTCNGGADGEITILASGGTSGYTYNWSSNANGQNTAIITGLTAGTYTVTVTDANNCSATFTHTLVQPQAIQIQYFITPVSCGGTNDGSITLTPNGGTPGYTYQWGANANNQTTATAIDLSSSTYSVTVTDSEGCTSVANGLFVAPSIAVDSADVPLVVLTGSLGCDLAPIGALGINTPNIYTYLWSNGATTQNATGLGAGPYSVTVSNALGCFVVQNGTITSPFVPDVNPFINTVGTVSTTVSSGTTVTIDGGNDQSGLGVTYVWTSSSSSDITIGNATSHTTTAVSDIGGTYTLTITATATSGCTDTGTVILNVQSSFVGMPNAFSPNGDGTNDFYLPVGLNAHDIIRFRVFNRWGQEIYAGDELENGGWDGRYMGVEQPSETYLYLLEYNLGANSTNKMIRGEFTLMR